MRRAELGCLPPDEGQSSSMRLSENNTRLLASVESLLMRSLKIHLSANDVSEAWLVVVSAGCDHIPLLTSTSIAGLL